MVFYSSNSSLTNLRHYRIL